MTLREWCRANWNKIDAETRKKCIDHLDSWFDPATKTADIEWLKGYRENANFHFLGGGMRLRNRLREVLADDRLPVITTNSKGEAYGPTSNWDDYYTGAIDELLERYP